MFNKLILVGNLTRDCELKYTQGGSAITNTAIATNRKYKAQDGTQKEEVCFVDITFFGRTAEIANEYLGRGKKVLVEGRLKFDQWTDQNGNKRSKHSVVVESLQMLGGKNDSDQNQQSNQGQQYNQQSNQGQQYNQQSNQGQQYNQHQQPQKASQQKAPNEIPEIDIDAGDIPF